ncbi:MAG: DivIVA domain-containing protein [Cyclobacteriaceae bacterium]
MKVTPLEIRQKGFEKVFRGYDKDEVSAFLQTLSQEWEKIIDENKEYRIKLEAAEREVEKLREVENSLFKTLKTAEDTGANMIQQANKAAELQLKETQMKSEKIMRETKAKAKEIIEGAEKRSKDLVNEMVEELRALEQAYNQVLTAKENLIAEIRNYATDTLERVEGYKARKSKFDLNEHVKSARELSMSFGNKPPYVLGEGHQVSETSPKDSEAVSNNEKKAETSNNTHTQKSKSFFDSLD